MEERAIPDLDADAVEMLTDSLTSSDELESIAAAFLKAQRAGALDAYVDSNASLYRAFGGYGLPVSVLIDAEGNEIARAEGPADWSDPDSIAWLKQLAER